MNKKEHSRKNEHGNWVPKSRQGENKFDPEEQATKKPEGYQGENKFGKGRKGKGPEGYKGTNYHEKGK